MVVDGDGGFGMLQKGVGKQIQDAGEDFSAAVQRGAESVKENLQGTQADVSGKAKSAGSTAESKVKQGAGEADSAGSSIADKAEDLKVHTSCILKPCRGCGFQAVVVFVGDVCVPVWLKCDGLGWLQDQLFGAGKGAQKETDKNVSKAQSGLSDAADKVKDAFKGKN
jgi:hypothetical protein